ncbi:hypothetical protein [Streptomyces sp. NBC_01429]|uniref:hypothetical protein n=1 Tax=Streptomyces sp. NBC_01429 TaxID=2903862 RepID=UPI002E2C9EEB|nr:hypothetical protein [Streptomyces sp. NBC_01429]
MWPGQQPPGGEQNPQDPNSNPYQQPGYQQPNPYQQPGYQQQPGYPPQPGAQEPGTQQQPGYPQQQPGYGQPNPYQQPTVPQYAVPGQPGGPGPTKDDGRKKTTVIAVVAAAVVVVAAAGTAYFVVNKDDGGGEKAAGDAKPSASATEDPSASPSLDNPRDGSNTAKPQIAGWKVVTNPKHGTRFDVPPEWEVSNPDTIAGFEDEAKGDGSPVVSFSGPTYFKSEWCSQDTDKDGKLEYTSLAGSGTKGARGAKNTTEAAQNEAGNWAWAPYAQQEPKSALKEKIKVGTAKPYTTTSGLKGSLAEAKSVGVTKKNKCDTDGKAFAFSFATAEGDFKTWILYASASVPDELPDATIKKILSTVRLAGESGSTS